MKICHVCAYACEDNAELCPICGAELSVENYENADGNKSEEDAVIVIENPQLAESIEDPVLAEVFCDALKENGILFTSDEPDLSGSMHIGFGGFYTKINVYVDEADLEKAKEIFNGIEIEEPSFDEDFFEEN